MTNQKPVYCDFRNGVARIVLNRPDNGNVISLSSSESLVLAINEALAYKPRAILLKAKGAIFCAGGDINEFVSSGAGLSALADDILTPLMPAYIRLASAPCPVVSAVNGAVAGAGIGLALCADFVLGSVSMKLHTGYAAIGLSPDLGASYFLGRRAGVVKAQQWFMLSNTLNAEQCLASGVIDWLCTEAELESESEALAEKLAQKARGSMASIKALSFKMQVRDLQEHLELEKKFMKQCASSAEGQEGVKAFSEKRPPNFSTS